MQGCIHWSCGATDVGLDKAAERPLSDPRRSAGRFENGPFDGQGASFAVLACAAGRGVVGPLQHVWRNDPAPQPMTLRRIGRWPCGLRGAIRLLFFHLDLRLRRAVLNDRVSNEIGWVLGHLALTSRLRTTINSMGAATSLEAVGAAFAGYMAATAVLESCC
jgi:hypothetical protein